MCVRTVYIAATFVSFLLEVDSIYEVHDYVKSYLGETSEAHEFAKQFLERRQKLKPPSGSQQSQVNLGFMSFPTCVHFILHSKYQECFIWTPDIHTYSVTFIPPPTHTHTYTQSRKSRTRDRTLSSSGEQNSSGTGRSDSADHNSSSVGVIGGAGGSGNGVAAGGGGGGGSSRSSKKKKKKMQKVNPAAMLGFTVNAAERPNMGEIQSIQDTH